MKLLCGLRNPPNYFALTFDIEKKLNKILSAEKVSVKILKEITLYDYGMSKIEKWNEIVSFGALARCSMALESMLVLLSNGYIGSMNALLRQVYEFLVWSKLSIDNTDEAILKQLHDDSYDLSFTRRVDGLNNYYKRLDFKTLKGAEITDDEIRKIGRSLFSSYSCFTHASSVAQQNVFKSDGFYEDMYYALHEVGRWIVALSFVIDQYLQKCIDLWEPFGEDIFDIRQPDAGYFFSIQGRMDESRKARVKIYRFFEDLCDDLVCACFMDSRWCLAL